VFEGFLFNGEVEMLEVHLRELMHVVDYFIIVESESTFTEHEKRLFFPDIRNKFADMEHQIIHLAVDSHKGNAWKNEDALRQAIFQKGLHTVRAPVTEGDIVIVSDVDEILRPSLLDGLKRCTGYNGRRIRFFMDLHYYSFATKHSLPNMWSHPDAAVYSATSEPDAQDLRNGGDRQFSLVVTNSGWHCSWCFPTLRQMRDKMASYSHEEHNQPRFRGREHIVNAVRRGLDLFQRPDQHYELDESLDIPLYLRMNMDRFEFMLDRRGPTALFKDFFAR
jgi:beta-1,4-mannosyl-glycoprotein beta-1,4-N-acetylglucosaminyltransferase